MTRVQAEQSPLPSPPRDPGVATRKGDRAFRAALDAAMRNADRAMGFAVDDGAKPITTPQRVPPETVKGAEAPPRAKSDPRNGDLTRLLAPAQDRPVRARPPEGARIPEPQVRPQPVAGERVRSEPHQHWIKPTSEGKADDAPTVDPRRPAPTSRAPIVDPLRGKPDRHEPVRETRTPRPDIEVTAKPQLTEAPLQPPATTIAQPAATRPIPSPLERPVEEAAPRPARRPSALRPASAAPITPATMSDGPRLAAPPKTVAETIERPLPDNARAAPDPRHQPTTLRPAAPMPTETAVATNLTASDLARLVATPEPQRRDIQAPNGRDHGRDFTRRPHTTHTTLATGEDAPRVVRRETHFAPIMKPEVTAPATSTASSRETSVPDAPDRAPPSRHEPVLDQIKRAFEAIPKAPNPVDGRPSAMLQPATVQPTRTDGPVRVVEIQLQPASLGTLSVTFRLTPYGLKVTMSANMRDTAQRLQDDRAELVDLIRRAGYGKVDVSIETASAAGDPGTSGGFEGRSDARPGGRRDRHPAGAFPDPVGDVQRPGGRTLRV
ncbi:flagellar hook-length control protein FliK [Acuticoccus sp. M5D2P5]|uniref:flagellar hook-length control protein FliK n=1 Tax=Acuticoccus kalidii TaxID=2910977 RepID=UPI001F3CB280|nr:flagellar hook-length control protein FliK [Acuticoccus kalidii]MCF3932455.1 flagellar hook-length control protein FliK [Acuticoccus kalidii]